MSSISSTRPTSHFTLHLLHSFGPPYCVCFAIVPTISTVSCVSRTINPAEDSLNIALREITVTARDGRVSQLEQVYIRGSMVRSFIFHLSV